MQALFPSRPYAEDMEQRTDPKRGERLRRLRKAAGLSQRELAEQLDVHHSNIGFWERTGTAPRPNLLPQMAKLLGVSVEQIIGEQTPTKKAAPGGRLGKVFEEVSALPRRQQQKVIEFVEAFVAQQKTKA